MGAEFLSEIRAMLRDFPGMDLLTPDEASERIARLAQERRLRFGDPEQILLVRIASLPEEIRSWLEETGLGPCPECGGLKRIPCEACEGSGSGCPFCLCDCEDCDGEGSVECHVCRGSGDFAGFCYRRTASQILASCSAMEFRAGQRAT